VDFTGSAPQVQGSVNANYAMTLSACLYAFRCLVGDDVLYNAGVGRPLTVVAPKDRSSTRAAGGRGRRQRRNVAAHH
jgi:N-methylhydantoinase B/oxoprolinase/acetone carboxylase alpha subunit